MSTVVSDRGIKPCLAVVARGEVANYLGINGERRYSDGMMVKGKKRTVFIIIVVIVGCVIFSVFSYGGYFCFKDNAILTIYFKVDVSEEDANFLLKDYKNNILVLKKIGQNQPIMAVLQLKTCKGYLILKKIKTSNKAERIGLMYGVK